MQRNRIPLTSDSMTNQPSQPTTTHTCFDGKIRPGKGPFADGADRCRPCRAEYERQRLARKKLEPKPRVSGVGLSRGRITHGFYAKKLTTEEVKVAERLEAAFFAAYELDSVADTLLLHTAIVNFVKSQRAEPEREPGKQGDKNVRDYQAYYEREFRDILDKLALTPKQRRVETTENDVVRESIKRLFRSAKDDPAEQASP
jgi:hypothetical protein